MNPKNPILFLVLIFCFSLTGCSKPKIDTSTDDSAKSSIVKVKASLPEEKRDEFEDAKAYLPKVELYAFEASIIDTFLEKNTPAVRFKLKNNGAITLTEVEVTVYLKDANGTVIYEKVFHPVHVSRFSITDDNKPLKPNYIWEIGKEKWLTMETAPSEWKVGDAEARITNIKLKKAESTAEPTVKVSAQASIELTAEAQFLLGMKYAEGKGVPQDFKEAVAWYRKAAERGNAMAQLLLGQCYQDGKGVPQDYKEAVKWYRKAAEQGLAGAQYFLGGIYASGRFVDFPLDYVEGQKWLILAAAGGAKHAAKNRDAIGSKMMIVEQIAKTNAAKSRDVVAKRMTPEQLAEAQKLAREWKPKKAQGK